MAMRTLFVIFCLTFAGPSYAGDPLNQLRDTALSLFKPVKGTVVALVNHDIIISDLGEASGIKKGMRLTVKREGTPFVHPITKETVGKTETLVGTAEVIETWTDGSRLTVLNGDVKSGDILRVSSAKIKALFHQSKDVPWFIAEEYYWKLKETGRFELMDTAPLAAGDPEIVATAKSLDAEVAIVLSSEDSKLRQRLLWVRDSKELLSEEVRVDEDFIKKLKLGEELFVPPGKD